MHSDQAGNQPVSQLDNLPVTAPSPALSRASAPDIVTVGDIVNVVVVVVVIVVVVAIVSSWQYPQSSSTTYPSSSTPVAHQGVPVQESFTIQLSNSSSSYLNGNMHVLSLVVFIGPLEIIRFSPFFNTTDSVLFLKVC